MKKLAAALCLVSASAMATTTLDSPYFVSDAVEAALLSSNSWLEVYHVQPAHVSEAVHRMVAQAGTPPALAVGLPDGLRVRQNEAEISLAPVSFSLRRAGKEVRYDVNCSTIAEKNDTLRAEFFDKATGMRVNLDARAHSLHAFREVERIDGSIALEKMERLDEKTCSGLAQARVLYQGSMTVEKKGSTPRSYPVLTQVIQLSPNATEAAAK